MKFQQTQEILKLLLTPFQSASLVNDEGKLLASCDTPDMPSITSRLVIFQIMKKYLNPQIGDLFISNDPDNGGLNFQHIFFTTRLTDKLYMVFVKEMQAIDFKIPPTPLFERGHKNKMIWPFLVEQNPAAAELGPFFESQLEKVQQLKRLNSFLLSFSLPKNQQDYFKVVHEIFDRHFNSKALGQSELVYKLSPTDHIKLKLTIDDKLEVKTIYADFSQSSGPQNMSAASHIIESCLIKAIADYYSMSEYVSQPLLDHIRLTLPPQSIVSKSNPQGRFNLLLQKVVSEQVSYLLSGLTRQTKKPSAFKLNPEFRLELKSGTRSYPFSGNAKRVLFPDLDILIQKQIVLPVKAQFTEGQVQLKLKVKAADGVTLKPKMIWGEYPENFILIDGKKATLQQDVVLKTNDEFELNWKFN